jgi:pyridoxine 5-phosphate synthase
MYLNELLLRLLARDDPHPALFDAYRAAVQVLAGQGEALAGRLRAFELLLLREIGLLPVLDAQTLTLAPLDDAPYSLVPEGGLMQAQGGDRASLSGQHWQRCSGAGRRGAVHAALRVCAVAVADLKPQLRTCCTTIAACHAAHPPADDGPAIPMTPHTALSVNLNKVALVRNTRHLGIPSVLRAATLCLQAGAQGITVHPRPDERHIRADDVHDVASRAEGLAAGGVQHRGQSLSTT